MFNTSALSLMIRNPQEFYIKFLGKYLPDMLWNRYATLCQKVGLKKPTFILSFDCDTDKDIQVALGVHQRLNDLGIMPVYAVPGELLQRGEKIYKKIQETGAEFINHGSLEHTQFKNEKYVSTVFYDQLSFDETKNDIYQGHQTLKEVLGVTATGFRTPHFGTFSSPEQLNFLYKVLEELEYKYSSSTMPWMAFKHGTLFSSSKSRILEIPLTGFFDHPFLLLDSWGMRYSANRQFRENEYKIQVQKYVNYVERDKPILINLYADPSQVYDWEDFFEAMKILAPYNVGSYLSLIE